MGAAAAVPAPLTAGDVTGGGSLVLAEQVPHHNVHTHSAQKQPQGSLQTELKHPGTFSELCVCPRKRLAEAAAAPDDTGAKQIREIFLQRDRG